MPQQELSLESQVVPVEAVLASLRRIRIHHVTYEYQMQQSVAKRLAEDGIPFAKEFTLGPRNRIDFLIPGGIGVECKKGTPNSRQVAAQIERYSRFPQISAIVLVVERHIFDHDRAANGKPVHYISLSKLWGIAL